MHISFIQRLSLSLLTATATCAFDAHAVTGIYSGTVQDVWVISKDGPTPYIGTAEVTFQGNPIQLQGCVGNSLVFSIKREVDPAGPAMFAAFLAAKLSGKPVKLNVMNDVLFEGRCTLRYMAVSD